MQPDYRTMPFKEANDYLASKVPIPIDNYKQWLDSWHNAAFVVSGMKGTMLANVFELTQRAIAQGMSDKDFATNFAAITDSWAGAKTNWRANLVLRTNLRMAYGAGRYAYQLDPQVLQQFQFLRFVHSDHANYRPLHKALDGRVFDAAKIPFAVPSGFGCGCRYISMDKEMVISRGLSVSPLQRGDMVDGIPVEPEKGFDYQPKRLPAQARDRMLLDICKTLPPDIAKQVQAEAKTLDERRTVAERYLHEYQNYSQDDLQAMLNTLGAIDSPTTEESGKIMALKLLLNDSL